jgi:uncharacterized protein (TIGR00645 family)
MLKRSIESLLVMTRWLLVPFLVMLAIELLVLMVNASKSLWELLRKVVGATEEHVTLDLLTLVDFTLTGALVIIVIISVYENFVSELDAADHVGWPGWMRHIGFSELKLRLLSTIVAISAIKLLQAFMYLPETRDRDLYFYIAIHVTFVVSTVALAFADHLEARHKHNDP